MLECDKVYADGSVDFFDDETLDIDKAASFLCTDCLNEIVPKAISECFGVGVIHLDIKEIRLFEENLSSFGLGDFYIDCDWTGQKNGNSPQMDLLIFHCPIRTSTLKWADLVVIKATYRIYYEKSSRYRKSREFLII